MLKRFLIFMLILVLAVPAWAIKYKGDLESNESITFPEQATQPTSPAATKHKLYFKDDGGAYSVDSSGNENLLNSGGFKNRIINGNFDLWQRGTSFSPIGLSEYWADRWRSFDNGTTETLTITRQAFTLGQTEVTGEPESFSRHTITTLGDMASWEVAQRIEDVRTLAGQTVAISLWVRTNSATVNIPGNLTQDFGTGGSPSADTNNIYTLTSVTSSWQKFTITITLASISSKTIGTDNNDFLDITLNIKSNALGIQNTGEYIDIAQVQIEKGSVATEFEKRPIGLELALAQRYYQKTFPLATDPAQNAGGEGALAYRTPIAGVSNRIIQWHHKVTMRKSPTITTYNTGAANANWHNATDVGDSGVPVIEGVSNESHTVIRNPEVSTDGVGELIQIHAAADAEI